METEVKPLRFRVQVQRCVFFFGKAFLSPHGASSTRVLSFFLGVEFRA